MPWELGLAETHQTLILNNLRDKSENRNGWKTYDGKRFGNSGAFRS